MVTSQNNSTFDHITTHPRLTRLSDDAILARAAAKVNFTLAVGAERPDGYHMFESLMATVSLCDELIVRRSEPGIKVICDDPDVPVDSHNLVYRACSLLAWAARISPAVEIELVKRIPTEAGLGGASSDAAACLVALNELWGLDYPDSRLHQVGSVLGSDVNFFLAGPLAVCKGRGEQVSNVDCKWDFWAVLLKSPKKLSTGKVYKYHRVSDPCCFGLAERLAKQIPSDKPMELANRFCNNLEPAAFRVNDQLSQLRENLETSGKVPVRLSGSGTAMFAIFDSKDQAVQFVQRIKQSYPELAYWLVRNNPW